MSKGWQKVHRKRAIVDVEQGYYTPAEAEVVLSRGQLEGILTPDGYLVTTAWYRFVCGPNFAGNLTVQTLVSSTTTGNVYGRTSWARVSSGGLEQSGDGGWQAVPLVATTQLAVCTASITSAAAGSVIRAAFERDSSVAQDTLNGTMYVFGLLFNYDEYV